jgi:hypothetical protein
MITFQVTLAGKWGGLRTVTVEARSPESAKRKAAEQARPHEHVSGYAVPDRHDRDLLIEAQERKAARESKERREAALRAVRAEYHVLRTPEVEQGLNMVRKGLGDGTMAARTIDGLPGQPSKIAALVAFATYGGSHHVQHQFDRFNEVSELLAKVATNGTLTDRQATLLDEITTRRQA